MDYLIIRTRLQAIIAHRLIETGVISKNLHLVKLLESADAEQNHGLDYYFERLAPYARKTTSIVYPTLSLFRFFLAFYWICIKSRLLGRRIFIAGLRWYPLALALRLTPGLSLETFDDGTANVQQRNTSYLSEQPAQGESLRANLARWLFPRGPSYFNRSRIAHHYTIYPGLPNVVEAERMNIVHIDWETLITPSDRARLPAGEIRHILIGTAYEEARRVAGMHIPEALVVAAREWADLYIPHPREPSARDRSPLFKKYPAEAIICHYARLHTVTVAHYNSSTALSLLRRHDVKLVDLCQEPLPNTPISTLPTTSRKDP